MKDIKDIKIRNAYSVKNNLTFIYSENGKRKKHVIKNYIWYCVITLKDWKENKHKLEKSGYILKTERDGKYVKLFADKNEGSPKSGAKMLVNILNDYGIKVFESDLHSAKRFMVDNDIEVDDKYDILYFDIETDDTNRKIQIGATRILSFGAVDNKGNEFYFDDENEEELLKKAIDLFYKYDVITGWNIDEFDLPYIFGSDTYDEFGNNVHITGRAEIYDLPRFLRYKVARIDMLRRARKLFKEDTSLKSYSLENVSQHFLKKGKLKYEGKVIDMYNNDKEKLRKYNMNDVYLLKELDEKTGMIDLIAKECAMAKCLIRDFAGVYVSQVLDNMILREAHKNGIYAPSKRQVRNPVDYVGGLVFTPHVGYHKNVYVFDFKSLYPSIIMTSNIGFDTVQPQIPEATPDVIKNPGTGVMFKKNPQSVIAKVVEQLVEERQVYKKLRLDLVAEGKMQTEEYKSARANEIIVKELSNSVYGIMGNQGLRYYSLETAESITKTGHYLLRFSRDYFNSLKGCEVIYGDTDSLFVKSDKPLNVDKTLKTYHQKLQVDLREKFNIDTTYISLKYEECFSGLIMVGKKYYAGRVVNIEGKEVNEFIAKGIDIVKKAALPIVLEVQRKVIDLILEGKNEQTLKAYVRDIQARLYSGEFKFDDLKISTGINKELKDYKQINAPHVRVARYLFEQTGVLEVNEISYVIVDDNAPKEGLSGLALRETFDGNFDKTYYWNNKIFPPMERILISAFPNVDWNAEFKIKSPRKSRTKVSEGQQELF
jgi:DNA polymerase elongation subunit (family B)